MNTTHTVVHGDSRRMQLVADQSVQLVITSPPYWQLKDYGTEDQIGFHQDYQNYINNLNLVWQESYRVLANGCRLCINIGDQFARSVYYGRYKVIPIRTEIIKFCESIGFDYMGAIIWQKKITRNTTGGGSLMGSYPFPRNGIISIDYEFILLFKKLGSVSKKKIPDDIKAQSKLTKEEWKTYFSGHWHFGGAKQEGHLAMFPLELPFRLIKMFSFVGETVLDPFLGSGTTAVAANKLLRNSVGYEINADFIKVIQKKLQANQSLASENNCFVEDKSSIQAPINHDERIKNLKYQFTDYHQLDKKIDVKQRQFGSKIDATPLAKQDMFSIKQFISPEIIVLDNDKSVRLIGIKENKSKHQEAIQFLQRKTKNQKIVLRYDTQAHDDQGNAYAYVYLKNKTFLNAHLIKQQLCFVDQTQEFKYKNNFLKYEQHGNGMDTE